MSTPLQLARERSKLTQTAAAARIGIERSYYCRIETGRFRPHAEMAKKIVAFYGEPLTRDQVLFPEEYLEPGVKLVQYQRVSKAEAA
jgi:transcriptional regulator with XRE-family HTH domain